MDDQTKSCNLPPVCDVIFTQIQSQLKSLDQRISDNHADVKLAMESLANKVHNGLSNRISSIEVEMQVMRRERELADVAKVQKIRRVGYVESAVTSLVVAAVGVILWWVITQYVEHQSNKTRALIQQQDNRK